MDGGFFRNKEVKKMCLYLLAAALPLSAAGFYVSPSAGALVLCTAFAYLFVCLRFTKRRYDDLAALSEALDRVLHGGAELLSGNEEGELHVLKSQMEKMALTLRDQAATLERDKSFLADALSDISHQLKTPLTSMNLLTVRLRKAEMPAGERSSCLWEMDRLLSRMEWLVASILKMSRMDAGTAVFKAERVLVRDAAEVAAEPLLIAMELRDQRFVMEGEPSAGFTGDLAWTAEALGNILKNCMEHTPDGGLISVKWEETPVFTEIAVSDTGSGIDKADLPKIFERFYQSAGSTGAGIGLALARMIVTAQNGIIKAENLRTGGCRFTVRFYKGTL